MDYPLVSVIIPAYNAEAFLEQTLRSVLGQTYTNLEILVIDDGSKDNTPEIVKRFMAQDLRIRLLQQSNAGVAVARNLGIAEAKGAFIAPCDADDIWYPENIERQVDAMIEAGNRTGLVYSWSLNIDENSQSTGTFRASGIEGDVFYTLVCHNFLGNASCSMMRRFLVQKLGGYNQFLKQQNAQGCEDWDLYLRIAESYKVKVVREFLVGYRKRPESMSRNYETMARSHALIMEKVQLNHPEIPTFFYRLSKSNLSIYFAHQSSLVQDYSSTFFWLKEAIKAEYCTPFIRPRVYLLLISCFLNQRNPDLVPNDQLQQQQHTLTAKTPTQQRLKLQLMLWVENAFHSLVMRCGQRESVRTKNKIGSRC